MNKIAIIVLLWICASCHKKTSFETSQENIRHIKLHHIYAVQIADALEEDRTVEGKAPKSIEDVERIFYTYFGGIEPFGEDNEPLWEWVDDGHYLMLSREIYVIDGENFRIGLTTEYKVDPSHISWNGKKN